MYVDLLEGLVLKIQSGQEKTITLSETEALYQAIELAKKQIKKAPIWHEGTDCEHFPDEDSWFECPSCSKVCGTTFSTMAEYCEHCAQRLDWSVFFND